MNSTVKSLFCIAAFLAATALIQGCGGEHAQPASKQIVVTTFPLYDWTKNIAEGSDGVSVKILQDDGNDLHNYQPSASDIISVGNSALFIHVGGISDAWVEGVLAQARVKPRIINCLAIAGHCTHGEGHSHGDCNNGTDEHIWLSLRTAAKICTRICNELCNIDPDNKRIYESNRKRYCDALNGLDQSFTHFLETTKSKTLLVADRFPFIHFVNDYGLKHYAAFSGCSSESDASFKTILSLAEVLKKLNLKTVFTTENSDSKIARRILETAQLPHIPIIPLDSMQNTTLHEGGPDYISVMSNNIEKVKSSLR